MGGPGTKPPWPAWDRSPSGHRGVVLALQRRGVVVRKESHRTLPVPGQRLLLPGLLSGVVPTASVPAVAAAYRVLLSSEPGLGAARALWGGERAGCPALRCGGWRVDSSRGVGEALVCCGVGAREGVGDFLPSRSALRGCARGLRLWLSASPVLRGRGGRREPDVAFGLMLGSAFPPRPEACSVRRLWSLLIIWVHL